MKKFLELNKVEVSGCNLVSSKGSFNYIYGGVTLTAGECDPKNEVTFGSWKLSIVGEQELYLAHEDIPEMVCLEWAQSDYDCERRTQISGLSNNSHTIQRLSTGVIIIRHGDDVLEINATNGGVVIIDVR